MAGAQARVFAVTTVRTLSGVACTSSRPRALVTRHRIAAGHHGRQLDSACPAGRRVVRAHCLLSVKTGWLQWSLFRAGSTAFCLSGQGGCSTRSFFRGFRRARSTAFRRVRTGRRQCSGLPAVGHISGMAGGTQKTPWRGEAGFEAWERTRSEGLK